MERPPAAVWALAAAQVLLSVSYALLTPAYWGPDETQHVDMARVVAEWQQWPRAGGRNVSMEVRRSQAVPMRWPRDAVRTADNAVPSSDRPSFEELDDGTTTGSVNHISQHPPFYYALVNGWTGFVVGAAPVDLSSVDRTVLVMRSLGAVLGGLVVIAAWLVARRSGFDELTCRVVAACPLLLPMFTWIHGTVNNDVLLNAAVAALMVQLAGVVVAGDVSRRATLVTGLLAGVAAAAKASGVVVAPMIVLAALWAPASPRSRLRFVVGSGLMAFVVGGWWWFRNLILEGDPRPAAGLVGRPPDPDPTLGEWLDFVSLGMWRAFVGRFGTLNIPIEGWVLGLVTLLLAATAVTTATRWLRRDRPLADPARRHVVTVALVPFLVLLVAVLGRSAMRYATLGRLGGVQGRYTFLGMVGVALVVGIGIVTWRYVGLVLLAGTVAVAQTAGATVLLRRFYGGPGAGLVSSIEGFGAWSPLPRLWTFGTVVLAFTTLLVALALVVGTPADGHASPVNRDLRPAAR